MTYLTSQGTSPEWGWATGGTPADNARATYLADQLRALGLKVRLEPVPVDVLTFHSASVFVGPLNCTRRRSAVCGRPRLAG